MKRILLLICTILCANVLFAQVGTRFWVGNLRYEITSINPPEVKVCDATMISSTTANIPETVSYEETTYSVTSIGSAAFNDCTSLTSVTIPNSVTSIGSSAFYNCSNLTSVTIPNSVTSIGNQAFMGCWSLTSVTLPQNATISNSAFVDAGHAIIVNNIMYVSERSDNIPLTIVGNYTFNDVGVLLTFYLNGISYNNYVEDEGLMVYLYLENISNNLVIPSTIDCNGTTYSVTSIDLEAFKNCSSLTSVDIPNGVTSIGESAFMGCSSLTSVTIPNSVTSIGGAAFYGCSSLTSVTLSNNITSLPSSYESIVYYGFFEGCSSLTSVTIPNGVTYIGEKTFSNCSSLTSVTIGNSVTSIGNSAFKNCSSLTSVDIPNGVTSIGNSAFSGCTALQNITLGESVASIGSGAFSSSSFLQNVTCLATTPPTLADNTVFPYPNIATLTVPCGTLEAYSSPTSFWNMFFMGRISEDGYNVVATANDNAFGSVAVENNCSTATLSATANACYQFVGWNDGNTENPRIVTLSSDTTLTANFGVIVNDIITSICQGQVYNENGFNVSEAGVYTQNLQTVNGCDSIVTLTLNVNPIYNTELTATICQGSVYTENGFNVSEAGVYTQNLQTINGCDSIVTLTLNVNPIYNTELTATICQGQTYTENNFNVSEAGVYTQTLTSVNGCDSIVTLTVSVNPTFDTTINATINARETYAEFGFNESESGTYVQNLQTINGCDSTITLNLTVNSSLYDVAELAEITFYPNPTSGILTFSKEIEKIEVIDNIGKIVMRFFETEQIDIETLPSGVYHLRLTIEDKTTTRKVIKE